MMPVFVVVFFFCVRVPMSHLSVLEVSVQTRLPLNLDFA